MKQLDVKRRTGTLAPDRTHVLARPFPLMSDQRSIKISARVMALSEERKLLLGGYFTHEYSLEAAALFNRLDGAAPGSVGRGARLVALHPEPARHRRRPRLLDRFPQIGHGVGTTERDGYVPTRTQLIIPYGISDYAATFATIPLEQVLAAME